MKCVIVIEVRDMDTAERHVSELFVEIPAERNFESEALSEFLRFLKNAARNYAEEVFRRIEK